MPQAGLPLLAGLWFGVVAPVVVVDGMFVLTRSLDAAVEHPLSNMFPFNYWLIYARYDLRYGPNDDAFVIAQAWLNFLEVALGLIAVLLSLCRANNAAVKLGLLVATMTLYKTVLYFVLDIVEDGRYTKHNTFAEQLTMIIIPMSFWVIIPAIIIKQCFRALTLANVPERRVKAHHDPKPKEANAQPKNQPNKNQQNQQNKKKK